MQDDRAVTGEVADDDHPLPDLEEGPVASVLGQPEGAADRSRAVVPRSSRVPLAMTPESSQDRGRALGASRAALAGAEAAPFEPYVGQE